MAPKANLRAIEALGFWGLDAVNCGTLKNGGSMKTGEFYVALFEMCQIVDLSRFGAGDFETSEVPL